jgi:hypothetical protein
MRKLNYTINKEKNLKSDANELNNSLIVRFLCDRRWLTRSMSEMKISDEKPMTFSRTPTIGQPGKWHQQVGGPVAPFGLQVIVHLWRNFIGS